MQLIQYSKCSTCKKACKWLDDHDIKYNTREIKEDNPTKEELIKWTKDYSIPINKLFNTSGIKYRELNLKDKLSNMNDSEKINLLSSDGMLIKRPLLITNNKVLIGFKEKEWSNYFNESSNS